jgi:hypothetical protein
MLDPVIIPSFVRGIYYCAQMFIIERIIVIQSYLYDLYDCTIFYNDKE